MRKTLDKLIFLATFILIKKEITDKQMRNILLSAALVTGSFFTASAHACPNWNLQAAEQYSGSGSYFYTPRHYNIVAGGDYSLSKCSHIRPATDVGPGFFPDRPDFRFNVSGMAAYELHIRVVSECDAALLINTASATWYYDDDDNGNLDPRIILTNPQDGPIDIWVGTYDGAYCNARLEIETF